jgi:mannitol/fructose-specific phosphotransferase system IIA component (Ntr-type)
VNSFLDDINKEYFLDLTKDDELFIGLVLHVRSVVNRLRYSYELKSTILDMLKNKYPLTFEMSLLFRDHFSSMFNIEMEENELSYIAAHLGAAIKRIVDSSLEGQIKVAVASHLNYSSTQLLLTKLKSIYGQAIQIAGPFSVYEKEKIAASNAAIVLSTVNIKDIPIKDSRLIVVSTFLEEQDLSRINRCLEGMKRDFVHPKLPMVIKQCFDKELFHYGVDMESRDEVITFLSQELIKKSYVAPAFLDAVLEREKISSTAFENGIAMPHPISNCSYKTVISVATLKKPILWNGQKVQYVFLLALREEDKKYLIRFFDLAVDTLNNTAKLKKVAEADTFEKFIDIIS